MTPPTNSQVLARDTLASSAPVPQYLQETYWWAYVHPNAVRVFERQWLVNLILWGNFTRLRDVALAEFGHPLHGKILQVACVYGDFTQNLARRLHTDATLNVVDVAPVQISNLQSKLRGVPGASQVHVLRQDSTDLAFEDASHDAVIVFFLLHEQPLEVRQRTVAEALRVTRPGGKLVFVDYHRPTAWSPFRYIMVPILRGLEPFAMDLWRQPITDWLPSEIPVASVRKETYFGGLYQKVVVTRA